MVGIGLCPLLHLFGFVFGGIIIVEGGTSWINNICIASYILDVIQTYKEIIGPKDAHKCAVKYNNTTFSIA